MVSYLQRQQQPADSGLRQATREPTGAAFQMDARELGDYLTLCYRRLAKAVFYHAVLDTRQRGTCYHVRSNALLWLEEYGWEWAQWGDLGITFQAFMRFIEREKARLNHDIKQNNALRHAKETGGRIEPEQARQPRGRPRTRSLDAALRGVPDLPEMETDAGCGGSQTAQVGAD